MLAKEFLEMLLEEKQNLTESSLSESDTTRIIETANLISGNLVYPLCRELLLHQISIEDITSHLEKLYDCKNFYGIIYLFYIMLEAMDIIVPYEFIQLIASDSIIPILSEAIIDDWLEFDFVENDTTEWTVGTILICQLL